MRRIYASLAWWEVYYPRYMPPYYTLLGVPPCTQPPVYPPV